MTRRSDSVAVVILESANRLFEDPYFNQLLLGISGGLADREVQLVLLIAQSAGEEERLERYIAAGHVDGAMIIGPRGEDELPRRLLARGVAVVVNGRPSGEEVHGSARSLSYVDVENREGARAAVAHPLDLSSGRDRLEGYRDGLVTAGLPLDSDLEAGGGYLPALAAEAMGSLLAHRPDLDAVFAASDSMAASAIGTLLDAGRRVPEDVAVVGFDDSPIAMTVRPSLTTVRQPIAAMGREMAELLLRQVNGPEGAPRSVIFPTELVVRESSAPGSPSVGEQATGKGGGSPWAGMASRPAAGVGG
jgi:DNA-binding LacI/PurR family transcriptional regulator